MSQKSLRERSKQDRYNFYLARLAGLSWDHYQDLMEAEGNKPEAEQHWSWNDPEFIRARRAFERHMCPFGGGRGRIPNALKQH